MLRSYIDTDYDQLKDLYQHTEWYGGVFDESRDGRTRLQDVIQNDPDAIIVFEEDERLTGTISIIDDSRVAMLYRFVVKPEATNIARELYDAAIKTLRKRGHTQILVYSAPDNQSLNERYAHLGMNRGGEYICFWVDI